MGPGRGRGGRSGRFLHGTGQPRIADRERSVEISSATSVVEVASPDEGAHPYQQRKKKGFHVGDSCFTDVGGAFRPGIIVGVPANTGPKYYRIKLSSEDFGGDEEDDGC